MSTALRFDPIRLPQHCQDLRREVRAFLAEEISAGTFDPQVPGSASAEGAKGFSRRVGERGWIGMTWPKQYGGQERSFLERYVVTEEMRVANAPVRPFFVADRQSGPTLIRYVDRFLMFYVRTAERLQRTSVWRDNLEGGLDYLKEVICEDRLGIGAELEADMERVIGTYACEWKVAIEDPQTLRRFRHFINSDDTDDRVVFVDERGQPRPATRAEREAAQATP